MWPCAVSGWDQQEVPFPTDNAPALDWTGSRSDWHPRLSPYQFSSNRKENNRTGLGLAFTARKLRGQWDLLERTVVWNLQTWISIPILSILFGGACMSFFTFLCWLSQVVIDLIRLWGLDETIEGKLPGHPVYHYTFGPWTLPGTYWGLDKYSLNTSSLYLPSSS